MTSYTPTTPAAHTTITSSSWWKPGKPWNLAPDLTPLFLELSSLTKAVFLPVKVAIPNHKTVTSSEAIDSNSKTSLWELMCP